MKRYLKAKIIIFRSVGFADWLRNLKDIQNSRQKRSKNKLFRENKSAWRLFTPGYGLLTQLYK